MYIFEVFCFSGERGWLSNCGSVLLSGGESAAISYGGGYTLKLVDDTFSGDSLVPNSSNRWDLLECSFELVVETVDFVSLKRIYGLFGENILRNFSRPVERMFIIFPHSHVGLGTCCNVEKKSFQTTNDEKLQMIFMTDLNIFTRLESKQQNKNNHVTFISLHSFTSLFL